MSRRHNIVFIMTDAQCKHMVGAYGRPIVDTPNLDRLCSQGVRFNRAYTASPICTPARGAIFSGQHPQVNGAWCNNIAPSRSTTLMGEHFRGADFRAGYTGKWHLEGGGYFGDGEPDGGFEPDWWYDGRRYLDDIGPDMAKAYGQCKTPQAVREAGFTRENMWGNRVADRAVNFLEQVGDDPFVLVVSFDEPHGPYMAPAEYWERVTPDWVYQAPSVNADVSNKPLLQQRFREPGNHEDIRNAQRGIDWDHYLEHGVLRKYGCNSYIDREIGRVIDAVDKLHGDDTAIIYTSDHGDNLGAHGLIGKGPSMYDATTNIPLIARLPDGPQGLASDALISHIDLMPTICSLAGIDPPDRLHGQDMTNALHGDDNKGRDATLMSFHRFGINHVTNGGFYPIRCLTDGRYKLSINLFDTDEFYDLHDDPFEVNNRIEDTAVAEHRDRLHDQLLDEMDRIQDPYRTFMWSNRSWRNIGRLQAYAGDRLQQQPT